MRWSVAAAIAIAAGGCGSDKGKAPAARDDERALRAKILTFNQHLVVMKRQAGFAEYRDVVARVQAMPDVVAVQPFVMIEAMISDHGSFTSTVIKGAPFEAAQIRGPIQAAMVEGALFGEPATPAPLAIGRELARSLHAKVGDDVTITMPAASADAAPIVRSARIAAIFYSGVYEYDRRMALTPLAAAQDLAGEGDVVMGVEARMARDDEAAPMARQLGAALGDGYSVMDWCELNRNLLHC